MDKNNIKLLALAAGFAALATIAAVASAHAQNCLPPNIKGAKLICNANDLMALNNYDPKQVFQLGADIDLWGVNYIPPDLMAGTLDFRKFAVRNLSLNKPAESGLGLIRMNSGIIKNAKVYGVKVSGRYSIGGLVGTNFGRIQWAQVSGQISGNNGVGGIVGLNYGLIRDASLKGSSVSGVNVQNSRSANIGGIVGASTQLDESLDPSLLNVHFNGTVSGSSSVGGIVGDMHGGKLIRASIQGATVVSGDSESVGGIVGNAQAGAISRARISEVIATSTASVSGEQAIGGLVGSALECDTDHSFSAARVSGVYFVGGLVGDNLGNVTDSFATGAVIGFDGVGGLAGRHASPPNQAGIKRTYSTGAVRLAEYGEASTIGGLIGNRYPDAKVVSSYWNATANKNLKLDGNARTIEQLHSQATFKGFDFVKTWFMPKYFTPQLLVFK